MASIDFLITGRGTAGVIQGESRCDEGDADGVNAYIDPTLVGDAEVQVECQSEEQTPGRGSSLATCERGVVESRPRVVDEQAFDPITEFTVFTDHFATKSNQASAGDDEDGVSEHLKMKTKGSLLSLLIRWQKLQQLIFCKCFTGLNHIQLSFLGLFWCMALGREWKDLSPRLLKDVLKEESFQLQMEDS